jgi:ferritin-like metal-binding protein YciE
MQHLNSLHDLFVHELRDLYDAEQQLVNALPEMAQAAHDTELREAFEHHLDQTRTHVKRLNTIFADLGMTAEGEECEAMKGLIKEGKDAIKAQADSVVKDAALIAAAQRVEHYEMAGYGSVRTYADEMGHDDIADLLQQTLDEEGNTDKTLTKLAKGGLLSSGINEEARARRNR